MASLVSQVVVFFFSFLGAENMTDLAASEIIFLKLLSITGYHRDVERTIEHLTESSGFRIFLRNRCAEGLGCRD